MAWNNWSWSRDGGLWLGIGNWDQDETGIGWTEEVAVRNVGGGGKVLSMGLKLGWERNWVGFEGGMQMAVDMMG